MMVRNSIGGQCKRNYDSSGWIMRHPKLLLGDDDVDGTAAPRISTDSTTTKSHLSSMMPTVKKAVGEVIVMFGNPLESSISIAP